MEPMQIQYIIEPHNDNESELGLVHFLVTSHNCVHPNPEGLLAKMFHWHAVDITYTHMRPQAQ